jgi:hypothetical protein
MTLCLPRARPIGDIQKQREPSVLCGVNLVRAGRLPHRSRVGYAGSACAALLCACPQLLEDTFAAPGESGGVPALLLGRAGGEAQPGGASGDGGESATSGANGTPEGGGAGAGAEGGVGGAAPPRGAGGESGAAGSGGSVGTSNAIVWNGDAASSCSFAAPELLSGFGIGSFSHWGPALRGAQTLLFAAWPEGNEDVFETSRPGRGTSFEPAALLPDINTASNEGTPFLSPDALSIYFYSTRAGGAGDRDLYVATRSSISNAFSNTERLANVNSPAMDYLPRLSNERTLVFTSTRSNGQGAGDLWFATRDDATLDFEAPVPLEGINTSADEEAGQLSADQLTLVFGSNRSGGVGGHDLWFATRSSVSSPFASPVNLSGLNSANEEFNVFMSEDGEEILFSSNRVDGATQQLWRAIRNCDL